jgi:hypothetical protein
MSTRAFEPCKSIESPRFDGPNEDGYMSEQELASNLRMFGKRTHREFLMRTAQRMISSEASLTPME